jgi:tetratricopeptide (TPR) repeat protein
MAAPPEQAAGAPGAGAAVLAALVAAALAAAAFAGDGSGVGGILPVGGAAGVLLAVLLSGVAGGRLPLPRAGRSGAVLLVATVALTAWTGATVAWSIAPDRSWDAFNRSLAFTFFLGLGLFLARAGGRAAARLGAGALALVLGAVLAWALLAKAVPALDSEGGLVGRLHEPVGYWNALALLADAALVAGLWLGAALGASPGRRPAAARVAGGLLVYLATLALLLTLSRAGAAAGVLVVTLWLVLAPERVAGGLLLAVSAVPAAAVGAWALTRPALVEDGAARADRVADGALLGVLTLAGAVVAVALVVLGSRRAPTERARRVLGRGLVAASALAAVAVLAVVAVAAGRAVTSGARCAELANAPGRYGSLDLGDRWCWWREAWDVFAGHAPEGAGAGTFALARKRYRADARSVSQPHSVPLQQLADGGVVALALFLALAAAGALACACALRRLEGEERSAALALVALPFAYLLHALVDFDWDFLAVTAPALTALGVLAGAGRGETSRRRRPLLALGTVLLLGAVLVSFAFPRLAERSVRASTAALEAGDAERADEHARWARFFDPLAVEPVFALARVAERRGFRRTAEQRYVQAVELQPENPETWYALGLYEFQVLRNLCAAYRFFNEAYTLDPAGRQWYPGGPLDVARDAVNAGACEGSARATRRG